MTVVDASVALAWCFAGEQSSVADAVLEALRTDGAVVPSVWPFEIGNALLSAERRGRLDPMERPRLLELLGALPIEVEGSTLLHTLDAVTVLARSHQLSVYDASYLELAARLGAPLATLDERLRAAASALGIPRVAGI